MKPEIRTIIADARRSLIFLASSAAIGMAAATALPIVEERIEARLAGAKDNTARQSARLDEIRRDLSDVKTHIDDFRRMKEAGIIGAPDRESWVEETLAQYKALHLPDTMTYTLGAPEPVPARDGAYRHDLEIKMKDIVETEAIEFLDAIKRAVKGRFRCESVVFSEPNPAGLTALVRLRFFHVESEPGDAVNRDGVKKPDLSPGPLSP